MTNKGGHTLYYANVIVKGEKQNKGLVMRRLYNNIKSLKKAVSQSLLDKPQDVEEVVVLRHYESKPDSIHGYYNWDGEKLVLNKGIEPFFHNVIYGRR